MKRKQLQGGGRALFHTSHEQPAGRERPGRTPARNDQGERRRGTTTENAGEEPPRRTPARNDDGERWRGTTTENAGQEPAAAAASHRPITDLNFCH
ncbi:uncharacterized protein V6R79_023365 [Siganus canaliculatus]